MSELTTTYGWGTLVWRKLERKVLKLQTQIYRATGQGSLPQALGVQDKHPIVEEPCASKLASTVLKQRVGQ